MHPFMETGCDIHPYTSLALVGRSTAGRLPLAVIIPLAVIAALFLMKMFVTMIFAAKLRRNLGKKIRWEDHPQLEPILGKLLKEMRIRRRLSVFSFPGYKPLIFNSGWISPAIFISPLLLEKLTRDEMETVLAHELAHIGHYDQLVFSLVGVLKGLFMIVPYRNLLWRRFMLAREISCDETAIRVTSKRLVLAEALIKIWKMGKDFPVHGWLKRPALYYALLEGKSSLEVRVRRVLDGKRPGRSGKRGLRTGAGLVVVLMVSISAVLFQQIVGIGDKGRATGMRYVGELPFQGCHH